MRALSWPRGCSLRLSQQVIEKNGGCIDQVELIRVKIVYDGRVLEHQERENASLINCASYEIAER